MGYAYTPTYYSSIQHSLTSMYKSIFKSNKRRLQNEEKAHTEILKRQQEQFHKMLHLTALCKEGIVSETEVSDFRVKMLESIAATPPNQESPCVVRDKLLFLQELLHSKCISEEEYHSFKRPLLQRLAIVGEEISSKDIIVGSQEATQKTSQKVTREEEEEWSVIDLQDPVKLENSIEKPKRKNPIKQFIKPYKSSKNKEKKQNITPDLKNEIGQSEKSKRRERGDGSERKGWGLELGFKKWRKEGEELEEETTKPCLDRYERSDLADPIDDKILGETIKKELSRIKTELSATNTKLNFSDEQVEAISTKLPMDKSELNNYFPKAWCDVHGDNVLNVVKKEFKDHVNEIENARQNPDMNYNNNVNDDNNKHDKNWVYFEDDSENFNPNLFSNGKQQAKGNNLFSNVRDSNLNPFYNLKV